jgi:hypothetical protein
LFFAEMLNNELTLNKGSPQLRQSPATTPEKVLRYHDGVHRDDVGTGMPLSVILPVFVFHLKVKGILQSPDLRQLP